MLKFFRHIRQNLLAENKTGKYLKYAIGEIILVVIGILIALQINNWNEQRKSDTFELKMLGEIYKSLSYDNYIMKAILNDRILVVDSSINSILEMYNRDSLDMKSFNKHAINLSMGYIFSYSVGPYETLKIAGLDKVKNDTLRDKLIFHYDYEIPRRVNLIQPHSNSEIFEKTRDLEFKIFSYKITSDESGNTFEIDSFKLNNPRDELFMNYLHLRTRSTKKGISNFKNYMEDADKMIALLLKEFEKRHYPKPEFILL